MASDKSGQGQISGELGERINAWLTKHALNHARHELVELIRQMFGVTLSTEAIGKRERRLKLPMRDKSLEFHRNRLNAGKSPPGERPTDAPTSDPAVAGAEQPETPAEPPPRPPPTVEEELAADRRARRAMRQVQELTARYQRLLDHIENVELQRDEALGLRDAPRSPIIITPSRGKGGSEATAFAIASDWHIEEPVEPSVVNGLNEYNLEIAEARAKMFFERTLRMVNKEKNAVHINTLVLGLLGDFITGNIHEEGLVTNLLDPMDAIIRARDFLESGIRFLLEHSDLRIVAVCCVGNHSRITEKVYAGAEHGFALEWIMYHDMRRVFANEPRIQFVIENSYHTYLPVYDYLVRFHHGHAIKYRDGVGGLMIPLNKKIDKWNKGRRADIDVLGHWHQYHSLSTVVVNGSMIGYNSYAMRIAAGYEPPKQAFFLVDRDRALTVHIPILFEQQKRRIIAVGA